MIKLTKALSWPFSHGFEARFERLRALYASALESFVTIA